MHAHLERADIAIAGLLMREVARSRVLSYAMTQDRRISHNESSAVLNIRAALESGNRFVNVFEAFRQYRDQPELAGAQQQLFERIRGTKNQKCPKTF